MAKKEEKKEKTTQTEALAMTLTGTAKSFTEQTFLTGLNSAVQALSDPGRYAENYLGNLVFNYSYFSFRCCSGYRPT